ncbi:MAG: hypothetical protein ACI8X5_002272 [Planctomycetota bacterium]|jgi:hypothetical protein
MDGLHVRSVKTGDDYEIVGNLKLVPDLIDIDIDALLEISEPCGRSG